MLSRRLITTILFTMLVTSLSITPTTTVQAGCEDVYEPNGARRRFVQPAQVMPGSMVATLCPQGDNDVYMFTASAGDLVEIKLYNLPNDYDMELWGEGDTRVTSENGGTDAENIRWVAPKSMSLVLVVRGYDNAWSASPYNLQINVSRQDFSARQIRFNVKGGKFDSLKVVGENQYGHMTTWTIETWEKTRGQKIPRPLIFADTEQYWWQGTMILKFNVVGLGERNCVIDFLRSTKNSQKSVMYTEGQGCSGDISSGGQTGALVMGLYKVLFSEEDTLRIYGAVEGANKPVECAKSIIEGVRGPYRTFMAGEECGGALLDVVNNELQKYNKAVEQSQ